MPGEAPDFSQDTLVIQHSTDHSKIHMEDRRCASHDSRMQCREFYVGLRDWIVDTELDRYRSGRVFEYMWAVMFGEPAVTEPVEECDLLHCRSVLSLHWLAC